MLLVIDIGNTQITIGAFRKDYLLGTWRHKTDLSYTADQYGVFLSGILRSADINPQFFDGVVIASVVPAVGEVFKQLCAKYLRIEPLMVRYDMKSAPPLLNDIPAEVGADIIANTVGGYAVYGGPLIVVDFGTATSFDCISAQGAYLGGAFIPGIETSMNALMEKAALLSAVEIYEPMRALGTNTADCLRSGFIHGFAGQVDGILIRLKAELQPRTVVATGGLAAKIAPHCRHINSIDPNITLIGLRLLYENAAEKTDTESDIKTKSKIKE